MTKRGMKVELRVFKNEKDEDVLIGLVNMATELANRINYTRKDDVGVYDIDLVLTMEKVQ